MFDVVTPAITMQAKIPNMNGTSPIRVVMNALIAAEEFACSSYQCPINRYEQTPMISQPTSSSNRFGREHHDQHRAGEQRQHEVEPGVALVAVHVAQRVDVHHQRDRR
jgi:hypothetical protein